MQLIRGQLQLTRRLHACVATLGNFDGLHCGHQKLLTSLHEQARLTQLPKVAITFEPQPLEFFYPERRVPRLMRLREKWQIFKEQQLDYLVCLRFGDQLAHCSPEDFVQKILVAQLGVKVLIVGEDFRFGAKRRGDVELLQKLAAEWGFKVVSIPVLMSDQERISSTRIRQVIQANNFKLAESLLGRPYFLCGSVVHGDGRGRQLGFPTANINLHAKPVCVSGIYVVQVVGLTSRPLPGVANVGVRPMFANRGTWLEVYLLDFDRDIYSHKIKVEFLAKLRDEQRFEHLSELIAQIKEDVQNARRFFLKLRG